MAITEFNFTLIVKFHLKNRIFYLFPNVVGFLKNILKRQIRAHFKKIEGRSFWLERESVQNVARTPPLDSQIALLHICAIKK